MQLTDININWFVFVRSVITGPVIIAIVISKSVIIGFVIFGPFINGSMFIGLLFI